MATEDELRELSEKIARLTRRELVRVLDMALDVEDREREKLRAEILAENRAADAAVREAEKRLREAYPAPLFPPEAKRKAG
jgi:hypothetical protein